MSKQPLDPFDKWELRLGVPDIERAILHALLEINDHHDGCAQPGSDCPVGVELKAVAKRAAPKALHRLLGIS